jgi:hypothetical protein
VHFLAKIWQLWWVHYKCYERPWDWEKWRETSFFSLYSSCSSLNQPTQRDREWDLRDRENREGELEKTRLTRETRESVMDPETIEGPISGRSPMCRRRRSWGRDFRCVSGEWRRKVSRDQIHHLSRWIFWKISKVNKPCVLVRLQVYYWWQLMF